MLKAKDFMPKKNNKKKPLLKGSINFYSFFIALTGFVALAAVTTSVYIGLNGNKFSITTVSEDADNDGVADTCPAVEPGDPDENLWVTDGQVRTIAVSPNNERIYLGGGFTYVGPNTGFLVPFVPATKTAVANYPKVYGEIKEVISDGNGGFFVAGHLKRIGSVEVQGIAHILSDGSVDTTFNPSINLDCYVWNLQLVDSTLYFTSSSLPSGDIGKIDITTGQFSTLHVNWQPIIDYIWNAYHWGTTPGSFGTMFAVDPHEDVIHWATPTGHIDYISGYYAFSLTTLEPVATGYFQGTIAQFFVDPDSANDYFVSSYHVGDNAGKLWKIGGQSLEPTSCNDGAISYSGINTMVRSGSVIYLGGGFCGLGYNQNLRNLAAIDAETGEILPWDPDIAWPVGSHVAAMETDGQKLYLAIQNDISANPTQHRYRGQMATVDIATGEIDYWDENFRFDFPWVNRGLPSALSGSTLYINLFSFGGEWRDNLTALDGTTGQIIEGWNPQPFDANMYGIGGIIESLAATNQEVYVSGRFTSIGGQSRTDFAALNPITGQATDFNPVIIGQVSKMAIGCSRLYIAGDFTSINGQTRHGLAALDENGELTSWDPSAESNVGYVRIRDMVADGSRVYVVGNFSVIGGQWRPGLAAVDSNTGLVAPWNPQATFGGCEVGGGLGGTYELPGSPDKLAVNDSTVYVGGGFTSVNGEARSNLAAFDKKTAQLTSWAPVLYPDYCTIYDQDPPIWGLEADNSNVYAVGLINSVNGEPKGDLAAIDAITGQTNSWNPFGTEQVGVNRASLEGLELTNSASLYVFGSSGREGIFPYIARFGAACQGPDFCPNTPAGASVDSYGCAESQTPVSCLEDLDEDNIDNDFDNCPLDSNPDQADSDSPGIETVEFTRPYGSEYQRVIDCLTPDVCIWRASGGPIYNWFEGYDFQAAEWACGPCDSVMQTTPAEGCESETPYFTNNIVCLTEYMGGSCWSQGMIDIPGHDTCMHLKGTDKYWTIHWNSWQSGGGGGFSYTRTGPALADGIGDACDNCPGVYNPDQADSNGNGIGDVCEVQDADDDGVPNEQDICPDTPSGAEVDVLGCSQSQVDEDQDGVCNVTFDQPSTWCAGVDQCPTVAGQTAFYGCPVGLRVSVQEVDASTKPATKLDEALETKIYSDDSGSCAAVLGFKPANYNTIWNTCPAENIQSETNSPDRLVSELVTIGATTGSKFVLVRSPQSLDGTFDYVGFDVPNLLAGQTRDLGFNISPAGSSTFVQTKSFTKDSKGIWHGSTARVVRGSYLEVIAPDYAVWGNSEYIYPFVFFSDSGWTVDVCMEVPEGYQILEPGTCAQVLVAGEPTIVNFVAQDVGSPKPDVKIKMKLKHQGKSQNLDFEIPGKRKGKDK